MSAQGIFLLVIFAVTIIGVITSAKPDKKDEQKKSDEDKQNV